MILLWVIMGYYGYYGVLSVLLSKLYVHNYDYIYILYMYYCMYIEKHILDYCVLSLGIMKL